MGKRVFGTIYNTDYTYPNENDSDSDTNDVYYANGGTEHAGFSMNNSKHRAHPAHRAEEHARIYATGAGWVNDDEEIHEPPC